MATLLTYPDEQMPPALKRKVLSVLRADWPTSAMDEDGLIHDPATHPTSLVLVEGEAVLSYLAIPSKVIEHAGDTYKAYGLSSVITNAAHRHQGYGSRIVTAAREFIAAGDADIGVFTCDPPLANFYARCGWTVMEGTTVVGGTRARPFPSDSLDKCTLMDFFSAKAQRRRADFEGVPIYLELREDDLW